MLSNSELRRRTRAQLGGSIFAQNWLLILLATLIYGLLLGITGPVTLILMGPLEYGLCRMLTATARGKSPDFNDLFKGFTEDITNTILLGLLKTLFTFLWALLLFIPGIVKSYSYAMSSFIQQDSPNKDWRFCLDESRRVMDGKKFDLFLLDLSFLGWYIVGALCCGIGTLFVYPYHYQARANFYENIRAVERGNTDTQSGTGPISI